ncbi:MAG: mechanosensitive ion channel [Parvibaculaceae bacterium]|nr:mechanosensitive ion channel [Parvibaculaceae bacterium]
MDTQLLDTAQKNIDLLLPLVVSQGLNLLGAVLIVVIGLFLASWVGRLVARALSRAPNVDEMLQGFFASIARYAILTITGLAVLSQFGIQTASLLTVIGAAGLAVGLALQGTLSNVAAGVMLLIFRPFRVGHYVEVGALAGTVKELTLFSTELSTADNVQVLVPNSMVWGQPIKNYSFYPLRRADLLFTIGNRDDIEKAMAIISQVIAADSRCYKEPVAPLVAVNAVGQGSIDLVAQVWTSNANIGQVKFDLMRIVKEKFTDAGLAIPNPTQTIYLRTVENGTDKQA